MPVHYANAKRAILYAEWNEDGELKQVGGYDKFYKTIKLAECERLLDIDEGFLDRSARNLFLKMKKKKFQPVSFGKINWKFGGEKLSYFYSVIPAEAGI